MTKIFNPVMDHNLRPTPIDDGPLVNQMGLSRKHIFEAVDRSLSGEIRHILYQYVLCNPFFFFFFGIRDPASIPLVLTDFT